MSHIICFELLTNVVVQILILKKPGLLESESFETVVKWIVLAVIPLYTMVFYTLVYFEGHAVPLYYSLMRRFGHYNTIFSVDFFHNGFLKRDTLFSVLQTKNKERTNIDLK